MNEVFVLFKTFNYKGENFAKVEQYFFENLLDAKQFIEAQGYENMYFDTYSKVDEIGTTLYFTIETLSKYVG